MNVVSIAVAAEPADRRPPAITRADFVRVADGVNQAVDHGAGAVVLHGAPGWFCAGADLNDLRANRDDVDGYVADFDHCLDTIGTAGVPVVVAAGGPAIGAGFEIALCADAVVATEGTWFAFPEVGFGLPALSGAARLAAAVGSLRARNILLSCRRVQAAEARELGIVTDLVSADDLHERATALASTFASGSVHAVAAIKAMVATAPLPREETRPWVLSVLGS